jgi:diaminopimelate decarboxylase
LKPAALTDELLLDIADRHGTPLFVYHAETFLARLSELRGFDVVRYAQKANSNLALLALLRRAGALVDAVSAGEAARALRAGWAAPEITYTADLFDRAALALIAEHAVALNLGSAFMLADVARLRPGAALTLRVNPGFGHGHGPKVATGGEGSKHGIWHADLAAVVREARALGLEVNGLHVHIGSGSDAEHLARAALALEAACGAVGPSLATISAGGGLPIPYRPGEEPFDVAGYTERWRAARRRVATTVGREVRLEVEPGRYLVAEAGVLLARVLGTKRSGGVDFVLVDAGFHNLVRPAMYGAWHGISVVGRPTAGAFPQVVAGPLCESADVFTSGPRPLPPVAAGDLVCIHDAGAYGASMASNYNTQPLAAEVLVEDGQARLVRRRQTLDELLAPELDL